MNRPPPKPTLFPYTPLFRSGPRPVAMIFAREISDDLTSLVKKIEEATAENQDKKLASFVVFLNDDEEAQEKIKQLRSEEHTSELQSRQYLVCRLLLEKKD